MIISYQGFLYSHFPTELPKENAQNVFATRYSSKPDLTTLSSLIITWRNNSQWVGEGCSYWSKQWEGENISPDQDLIFISLAWITTGGPYFLTRLPLYKPISGHISMYIGSGKEKKWTCCISQIFGVFSNQLIHPVFNSKLLDRYFFLLKRPTYSDLTWQNDTYNVMCALGKRRPMGCGNWLNGFWSTINGPWHTNYLFLTVCLV